MKKDVSLKPGRAVAAGLLFLYVVTVVLIVLKTRFPSGVVIGAMAAGPLMLFCFCVVDSLTILGGRRAGLLLAIGLLGGLAVEVVGVSTGWPFGQYGYARNFGTVSILSVPLAVPMMWSTLLYLGNMVAERLLGARGNIFQAGIGALAVTAWDLMADPMMVEVGHWEWAVEGAYFGIPVSNYTGWLGTAFLMLLLYRWLARKLAPGQRVAAPGWGGNMAVAAYSLLWVLVSVQVWVRGMHGVAMVGFLAMGAFALPASGRVVLSGAKSLRKEYGHSGLSRWTLKGDPYEQFGMWYNEALDADFVEVNAMALATAGADGAPSARTMLLKDWSAEQGFVFFSNYESEKGRHLHDNHKAALLFFWDRLERQVRLRGRVEMLSVDESDAYFRARPRRAQLGAWASPQSRPVGGHGELLSRFAKHALKYANRPVERPPHWGGYRLRPESVEFWQGRPSRMHDRLRFVRRADGGWRVERLAP
ncbi:MAG: pyridoxamine 5'-phosphate oxidase [Anaerolineales bacterium]|jgi:pyridoxamine 5'-phosphate oxidase|nr:pyridoxamine 5'-phosphate oxidase [Anaerolineales bacterium]MDP7643309.1 pyridoxamine 5'-phosphate oxidase [Anaerolineales bacterium]HJN42135.1 pyridoxamine 5'-phosphate oxidase [Anaerolineales bacterium]|tara:strand:- start:2165 stop:3592 length:1428 start_codon:yes stop_codon:yes gene_type:complete